MVAPQPRRPAPREQLGQAVAVEDIVAQHESDPVGADKIGADDEGVGKPARLLLSGIGEAEAEIGAVAEQALETGAGLAAW